MPKSINKGIAIPVVIASALMLMAPMLASAQSPHFIRASSGVTNSGSLTCSFKEAGLGDVGPNVDITCSTQASAEYWCINRGENHPQAQNKETATGDVSKTGNFPVRNGQTTGTITVSPPPAPSDFRCPPGQSLILASVTYTNVQVCDEFENCVKLDDQSFTNPKIA